MSKKISIARPTKMELTRLKKRLKLAKRIQKIVKDRLSILILEFLQTVKEGVLVKEKLLDEFRKAYGALLLSEGIHGNVVLQAELLTKRPGPGVSAGVKNIAGVRIPFFEISAPESQPARRCNVLDSSSYIERTMELSRATLRSVIELAEIEKSLEFLGAEINKVKRINNSLEYILIPGIDATIRYLAMKFEERDREEVARLRRVKTIMEKKESHAY